MELPLFLIGVVVVLVYLARGRIGVGRTQRERDSVEGNRPIGYGEFIAPPGTGPGANVNAPYFKSDSTDPGPQNPGPGE